MAEERCYLAIDQGGHASRALLYETGGRLIAAAERPVTIHHPTPARAEHRPRQMVESIRQAVAEALRQAGNREVTAAGLAVQRSSVVCWDRRDGRALSPILSWQDRRNAEWLQQLQDHATEIKQRTGLPLSPHYGAGKLRWCHDHLPEVRQAAQAGRLAWGPLGSFLIDRLTVQHTLCTDPANASRTLLYNLDSGDWDPVLSQWFGLPIEALPPCVATRHHYGELDIAGRSVPLTLVTGDQSAALFAADTGEGRVSINLGTGAFLQQALTERPPPSPLLTSLAYRDGEQRVFALEGTVNGAGSALAWTIDRLGLDPSAVTRDLPVWLAQSRRPPLFLNGVAGLGTPYLQPLFDSRFLGDGPPAEQCVAVIESIVFLLQVNLETMARSGAGPAAISLSGGLSRLDGLCQRLADLSGLLIARPKDHQATARGLLRLLSGIRPPATETPFTPRSHPELQARYQRWRGEMERAVAVQT